MYTRRAPALAASGTAARSSGRRLPTAGPQSVAHRAPAAGAAGHRHRQLRRRQSGPPADHRALRHRMPCCCRCLYRRCASIRIVARQAGRRHQTAERSAPQYWPAARRRHSRDQIDENSCLSIRTVLSRGAKLPRRRRVPVLKLQSKSCRTSRRVRSCIGLTRVEVSARSGAVARTGTLLRVTKRRHVCHVILCPTSSAVPVLLPP